MASLGELFVELGFVGDTKQLEDFVTKVNNAAKATEQQGKKQQKTNNTVGNAIRKIRNFGLAISGAFYALNRMTDSLVAQNQAFLNFTRQTDISLRTMQKWAGVGAIVDKSLGEQGVAGTIESLNKRLFEMRLTGEGARGFILAGINPSGSAEDVLEKLRDRIQGMNNTQATWLLEQMGIDPRMITLLRMSREEFNEYSQAVQKFQLTLEQRQFIDRMNRQLQIARMQLQYLKDKAILKLMPFLVQITKSFARVTDGLIQLSKWLVSTKTGLAFLAYGIIQLMPLFKSLWAIIANNPLVRTLTLLYLLMDDIMTWKEGGDSLFGDVFGSVSSIKKYDQEVDEAMTVGNFHPNVIQKVGYAFAREKANPTKNVTNNVTMNNTINTSETAQTVGNELALLNLNYAGG